MQNTISLKAPNIGSAPELAVGFVGSVASVAGLAHDEAVSLGEATDRLVRFALEHAYPECAEGEIAVEAHLFDGGIRIDVHDGKLFTIAKHCEHDSQAVSASALMTEHDDHEQTKTADDLVVRRFEEGDEEGICRLVYRNYSNTYGADFFYLPEKLLERNLSGEVVSTVALLDGDIVGHHALLREEQGPLAETGAAVVHPYRKGLGIFNAMAAQTLEDARQEGLSAVDAQAVTIHPYSQKAAHTHGYRETALAAGRARASIRLESNELTRTGKRHAVVVAHLCFDRSPRLLFLPAAYRDQIVKTYDYAGLELEEPRNGGSSDGAITSELDAGLNVGTIQIGRWSDGDEPAYKIGRASCRERG